MSSFNDTVELERSFLKAMLESQVLARTYLHQAKEDFFTSEPRRFIFALAEVTLRESNSLLARAVFDYELASRIPDKKEASSYAGEWSLIDAITKYDPPESVIVKLTEADMGRRALGVSEVVIGMLQKGQIKEAVAHLKRSSLSITSTREDRPVVSLTEIQERLKMIREKQKNPEKFRGLRTGFHTFDSITGGVFPGELTLIAGITGLGKSTLCRSIAKGLATLNGPKNVLHVINEEYLEQVQHKYDALLTGIPYMDFKLGSISDPDLDRWQKFMQEEMTKAGRGQVFIKEVPAFHDVTVVEQAYRVLENRGIPIHAIIIDHLPHVKPIGQAWGENDERAKAAADCKELARWLRVPVITPTQAATEVEKKQSSGKRAGKLDVYGSKGQIHVANTFLIITFRGTDETQITIPEYLRDVFMLADVKKQRDGPPFMFHLRHYVQIGLIEEIKDPTKKADPESKAKIDAIEKELGVKTEPAKPVEVPVTPTVAAGSRSESVSFAEGIESDGEDADADSEKISEGESAAIDGIISGEKEPAKPQSAPQSLLAKIRSKKIV